MEALSVSRIRGYHSCHQMTSAVIPRYKCYPKVSSDSHRSGSRSFSRGCSGFPNRPKNSLLKRTHVQLIDFTDAKRKLSSFRRDYGESLTSELLSRTCNAKSSALSKGKLDRTDFILPSTCLTPKACRRDRGDEGQLADVAATESKTPLVTSVTDDDQRASGDPPGARYSSIEGDEHRIHCCTGSKRFVGESNALGLGRKHRWEKETRRGVFRHFLLAIWSSFGFQFPPKILAVDIRRETQEAVQAGSRVSNRLTFEPETGNASSLGNGEGVQVHLGGISSNSRLNGSRVQRKVGSHRPFDCEAQDMTRMTDPRTKDTGIQTRLGLSRHTHRHSRRKFFTADCSHRYGNAHHVGVGSVILGERTKVPIQTDGRISRELWSEADNQNDQSGSPFWSFLATMGLAAMAMAGAYFFAANYLDLKSRLWSRNTPSVTFRRPARDVSKSKSSKLAPKKDSEEGTKKDSEEGPKEDSEEELTDDNFVDSVRKRPTFVLFYPAWCPYCQVLDPIWKELGEVLREKGYDVQLARLNAEMHTRIADNFKVKKYPTLLFFKDGIAVGKHMGPRNVDSFVGFIDDMLRAES